MLEQADRRRIQLSPRSQLATELLLTVFSLVGSIIVLRTVLVVLDVSDRVWIGEFVYGLTRPVTRVLDFLPGSGRHVYGNLTTVDVTLLAFLCLFLLGVVATGRQYD
ncbi:hypothetical protein BH24CHL3_BH24CHL3_01360 [soil metagenome]|nr:hypothetical protein [Chloroflexia bacterium]